MSRIEWHDLLGVPWRLHGTDRNGMDCSTVAEEVLRRAGKSPPATSPFRQVGCEEDGGPALASYLSRFEGTYELLGDTARAATMVGDVLLASDKNGVARHTYVLVEPDRGTFLTAVYRKGVVAVRRFYIENVAGVYRMRDPELSS